jgi:antitoxin component YwqK of YwqJK toxin-antitoxin module
MRAIISLMLAGGCLGGEKGLEQPTTPPASDDSLQTLYHPNGMPRAAGRQVDGRRTGPWREWHLNGHLWLDGAYDDGRETGRWVEYHANGLVKFEGTYKNGLLDGEWKSYCETGKVHAEGRSVAGKLEGTLETRACRTDDRTTQTFVGNRPNGVWKSYKGERLTSDVTYRDGVYDGERHWYGEDGTKQATQTWANGLEVEDSSDEQ